jgi:hypothetical protein
MKGRVLFAPLFLGLFAARLCHIHILWDDEAYPLAGAIQMLGGKTLYRDIWYDKPPLSPAVYLLWGAQTGWPLRLGGALIALVACWLSYRFARELWSEREGMAAAALLAFFLTFDTPSAVMAMASDFLMIVPHIAAVYLAWRGRAFLSGVAAGVALGFSSKGMFVLVAAGVFLWPWSDEAAQNRCGLRRFSRLALGFLVANFAIFATLAAAGALGAYYEQVWKWGFLYAGSTFIENPALNGIQRTANWLGFHAALVSGAVWFWRRDRGSVRWPMAAWAALSLAGAAAGWRFFPRYFFQLLPVLTLVAARGFVLLGRKRAILVLLLVIPLVRFGPRYALLAEDLARGREHNWRDLSLVQDSRNAADQIMERAKPGDTLLVWGYRPDIWVFTRLAAGSRFMDSQPLTGVPADRHLTQSASLAPLLAAANLDELMHSKPAFIVDGIGPLNPALGITNYPDLTGWFSDYRLVGQTAFTRVYELGSRSTIVY